MRVILLAAGAMILANCTTPATNAANSNRQEADNAQTEDDTRTPDIFRKPPRQFGRWGGYGYGGRY
jgi:hypothetical protein